MKRLLVLDVSVRVLYPSILVLSLYFLFAGHNQPGGGFVGGLSAAAAISLRYVAGGVAAVRRSFRVPPPAILGSGLAVAVGTAIFPLLQGGAVLEHGTFEAEVAVLGKVKATSALPFDIGVYLIVVGLALMVFEAFGDDVDAELREIEPPRAPATTTREEYLPASNDRPTGLSLLREGSGLLTGDVDRIEDDGPDGAARLDGSGW